MEEAPELANYLPLSFKTPKEQEYIDFLWDAFETNRVRHYYAASTAPDHAQPARQSGGGRDEFRPGCFDECLSG